MYICMYIRESFLNCSNSFSQAACNDNKFKHMYTHTYVCAHVSTCVYVDIKAHTYVYIYTF